jgi:N-methylhydantoinase B
MDAVQAHFQNTENAPVEETEANYPVRILRYELIPDSEGMGYYRGGLGVRGDYTFPDHTQSFSILSDKAKFPPWGLFGGGLARPAKYILNPESQEARELPSKITFSLKPGDVVSVQTPGGGGCAEAWKRPTQQVAADVALEKISVARPRQAYGVILDRSTLIVDERATAEARAR